MPRKKQATIGSELDEALDVFGRAKQIYPKLVAKRDYRARVLLKGETALARLKSYVDASDGVSRTVAESTARVTRGTGAPRGSKPRPQATTVKRGPGRQPGSSVQGGETLSNHS